MKILLDTHTFIWYITDSPQLSQNAKKLIENENTEKLLSLASVWEMGIKHSIGKLNFYRPFMSLSKSNLLSRISGYSVLILSILKSSQHYRCITEIPLIG
jgi:PIN domain nuclease of toxin-antitoxin system